MDTKICKKCGKELPLDMFHKHPNTKDGRVAYCKACHKEYNRQRTAAKSKAPKPIETPSGGGRTYAQGLYSQGSSKVHSERTDVGVEGKRICGRTALRGGHSKGA